MSAIETSPEMRFVGSMLDKPSHEVARFAVPPDALGDTRAAALYAAILAVAGSRPEVRCEDVVAELEERGKLGLVGGADQVVILAALYRDESAATLRREVLRDAGRRAAQEAAQGVLVDAKAGKMGDAQTRLREALAAVQRFDGSDVEEPLLCAADYLEELVAELSDIVNGKVKPLPVANLGPLRRCLGQPRPGTLVVIGGYSHAGKSFQMQYLEREYRLAGYPTLRLSLEDAKPVTKARLLAEVGGFDLSSPSPDPAEAAIALRHLLEGLSSSRGAAVARDLARVIVTPEIRDIGAITRIMRRSVDEHGVKVVFVDYAQEIVVPEATDTRDRIARAVSALKSEAIRLGVTVMLGSQLRKPPSNVKNYEPTPHDLKDASELHHAAEVVILCWRAIQKAGDRPGVRRFGKVWKDKLTGSYPKFVMLDGIGGVVDGLAAFDDTRPEPEVNRYDFDDQEAAE